MKFEKCSKCGRHALMEKFVCKTCYGKYFLRWARYFSTSKVKIPDASHFISELMMVDGEL